MNFTEVLQKIKISLSEKMPFVAYRKPNQSTLKGIFQKNDFLHKTASFNEKGFVFTPFLAKNGAILFDFENSEIIEVVDESLVKPILNVELDTFKKDKESHIKLINKTISFIKSGKAEKVVISRKENINFNRHSVSTTFQKLLGNYKAAMVYVWFHPKVGLWMGATPETLVSINNNAFKTMALAGTQPFKGSIKVDWQQKEIEEQQFVTAYIQARLKAFKLSVSNPYTVKAGNLLHLRTDISGTLNSKTDLTFLIKSLHPTPAVCGLPKEAAQEFILKNENYNREFYTGFLGELNYNNASDLFVNLRCMKVDKNSTSVFVGGGITKDSIAKNEWQETAEKSKVMRKVLF